VPNVTDVDVTNALVNIIAAALPNAKVYPWIRYPTRDRDDEWIALFQSSTSQDLTGWMLARVGDDPQVEGFNHIVYELETWRILGIRGVVDTGVYTTASAGVFQGEYNTVKSAINADSTLGLGICNVSHRGLRALTLGDGFWSGRLCHIAECRLAVEIFNVTGQ
jgi:hypothetical protein